MEFNPQFIYRVESRNSPSGPWLLYDNLQDHNDRRERRYNEWKEYFHRNGSRNYGTHYRMIADGINGSIFTTER